MDMKRKPPNTYASGMKGIYDALEEARQRLDESRTSINEIRAVLLKNNIKI